MLLFTSIKKAEHSVLSADRQSNWTLKSDVKTISLSIYQLSSEWLSIMTISCEIHI